MKDKLLFMRELFSKNHQQFNKLSDDVEKIKDFNIFWSDSFLDFYPHESLLENNKQPAIYEIQPEGCEQFIINKSKNGNIYYACQYPHINWGSTFYLCDEQDNMIRLFYEDSNEEGNMLLSQVTYKILDNNLIRKVLFYMFDEDMQEETFYIYEFLYENLLVKSITRYDFFYPENDTILYQIEYKNNKVKILQKQL